MFYILGTLSLVGIIIGLFFREYFGNEFSNILLFGGVIVGCINVIFHFFISFFNKKN